MSILKMLQCIILLFLCLFHTGLLLLFNLLIILWKPSTRIAEFYNIVRRKPMPRDGKPPPARWNDVSLGKHAFVHLTKIREFSKNYRVVAIDLRGYSLSEYPAGRQNFTMKKHAEDIGEVITALGYKDCILVGYELGAIIATHTAFHFPDKVSKMIVFNQAAGPSYADKLYENLSDVKYFWPLLYSQVPYSPEFLLSFDDFKAFHSIFFADNAIRTENLTEEDLEVYKYAFSQKGAIYAGVDCYRNLVSDFSMSNDKRFREKVDWNILVIHGLKDKYSKKALIDDSKQYFPNGVFKSIADGTHFVHEDQPQVVNDLINEFLNEKE